MAVLQVGYIFLGGTSFCLAPVLKTTGAGAVLPTVDFPGVCRLEALQAVGQEAGSMLVRMLGCCWCFVCALCLAVLGYWSFV